MALRFAILGAARIAKPALIDPLAENPDASLVAIGASTRERALEYAMMNAIPNAGTYEEVIARDDVDVVYIALPPAGHCEWSLKALEAGKHVFIEKPATVNEADARVLVEAAIKAGKRLIEAFHYRWHPLFRRAVEIVQSGQLGELLSAEAEFSVPIVRNAREFRWQASQGGGALADLGCYPVSWLRHLAGAEPEVTAAHQDLEPDGIDRRTTAHFLFPSGLQADVICDMDPEGGRKPPRLELIGTKGRLDIDNPLAPQYGSELILTADGQETRETFPRRPTFAYQFDGIVEAIQSGQPVWTEGADLIANAVAMAAIRRVAATG
ncbi:Gfo/Idh/MocA family oxidoreductase [Aquidulcibacter sp.]|jgi:predicted dehydrogenase|uniref:Gfo/Idh/MocA family protein n=1 Tax=Aquidulcibacter sp. TaxID=2052990 RepID=UPI0028B10E18|nr:Gfo/Idh/MocA family oxidoreductase [Aquidulcibacter sp.]